MAKPRDQKIVAHMRNLEAAAASRDIQEFGKVLLSIRQDATLTPAQFGAIAKTIAQEQAATYYQVMTGRRRQGEEQAR